MASPLSQAKTWFRVRATSPQSCKALRLVFLRDDLPKKVRGSAPSSASISSLNTCNCLREGFLNFILLPRGNERATARGLIGKSATKKQRGSLARKRANQKC